MLEKYALIKIINGLLESKEVSLRELARKVNVGSSTAKIQLDYLLKNNIVEKRIIGRNHLFRLKIDNFVVRQIKILNSLIALKKAGFVEEILERFPSVLGIMLYGSVAKGLDDNESDIDVLIVTRKPEKLKPLKTEKRIKREITIILYTLAEWKNKAKEDKIFYENVMLNSINLYGEKPVVL